MYKTFLFDLDQTLFDTSDLEAGRNNGDWAYAEINPQLAKSFPTDGVCRPHEVLALLSALGYKVGIVTSSKKRYSEAILAHHGIKYDVLVTHEDTTSHKPMAEPILLAMSLIGANPAETLYVGDLAVDFEAAFRARVKSAGAVWSEKRPYYWSSYIPDYRVRKASDIIVPDDLEKHLVFSHRLLGDATKDVSHNNLITIRLKFPTSYSLGPYYTSDDPRHLTCIWTRKIISLKDHDDEAEWFALRLARAIEMFTPDVVTAVPPKPGPRRNRFEALLLKAQALSMRKYEVDLAALNCTKSIDGYKDMNQAERILAIDGAFESKRDFSHKKLLLIDDVSTTESTAIACGNALKSNGATEVIILTLGKSQKPVIEKTCSRCESPMKLIDGTHGRFWGCSAFKQGCRYTEEIA